VITSAAIIGELPGSQGTITFENLGLWDHTSFAPAEPFIIGDAGTGTLNIRSNSDVILFNQTLPVLGDEPSGHGTINIDGQGSELFVNIQEVDVGRFGTGVINITNGGVFEASLSPVYLGQLPDSTGSVHVSGTGSLFRAAGVLVGHAGVGSLEVTNGGWVDAAEVSLAPLTDATGSATVSGTNSRLSVLTSPGLLIVGSGDTGSLTVTAGGVAEAAEVFIGDGSTAHGDVSVQGAASQLIGQEEINVGYFGTGTLTLTGGGKAISPIINVNSQSLVKGIGTLQGDVTNLGRVAPGLSAGTLNVNGDYTQVGEPSTLAIELASVASHDRLVVSGVATLGGILQVSLINGFEPSVGQSFTVLTAADVDNTFVLAAPAGISVSYTPTSVVLHVTSAPCLPDVNNSGAVDVDDLIAVVLAWGVCPVPPSPCPADVNGSGSVDADDLIAVILGWGAC
jgi:T5SS/PEP-CTERM-associated repeat protein